MLAQIWTLKRFPERNVEQTADIDGDLGEELVDSAQNHTTGLQLVHFLRK